LKPNSFYLNAQWITPPARREVEQYFRNILVKYEETEAPQRTPGTADEINVEDYLRNKGYQCNYFVAKEWTVSNTVQALLSFYQSRAYGLCWLVADEAFHLAIKNFEGFCQNHYGSLEAKVSSQAKYEI
jgi:hypothetical protein